MLKDNSPIIIVRKKKLETMRTSGAWKVAYADFVTAMMALFIVLWMVNSSQTVQKAVGSYFRDPLGVRNRAGSNNRGHATSIAFQSDDMKGLKNKLLDSVRRLDPGLQSQIEITLTAEGLRIELMESPKGTFFQRGSAQATPALRELLQVLAREIGRLPNKLSIEGHTDSMMYAGQTYDNWDLSSQRANEARHLMQEEGIRSQQIAQVRGLADRQPRLPLHPEDPSNRRISLIVLYQERNHAAVTLPAPPVSPAAHSGGD